jgi:hypothetical protein
MMVMRWQGPPGFLSLCHVPNLLKLYPSTPTPSSELSPVHLNLCFSSLGQWEFLPTHPSTPHTLKRSSYPGRQKKRGS